MRGIEEAERMKRSALRRFYEDHFALAGTLWTLLVLVLSVLLNRLADIAIRWMGW